MAAKPVKKHGVTIRQLADKVPEGCSMPDFEQKPVTMALAEGRNATLRAVVCGEPRPEVLWYSSKGDLSTSSKYQIFSSPSSKEHVLQINKLTGEDTDVYRCVAVNPYGEAICVARLTIIEVGFRKKRKRNTEPLEDLSKELMDLRKMLKKRAPLPKKKIDPEQVWQLLMTADRKDYERLCMKYGIVDFRGMLRKLERMRRAREDRMAQYLNSASNMKHIKVTKEGVAFFELDLDLKDPESNIYLYKDGEMVPYSSDSRTKRSVRRLGKHYHFQIQDLWPEDAGIYQVKVEDAEIFSTELEARALPPRVVVPLAETRCEEQGDAVFECVLSNTCPNATWKFKQQPLKPSDKHEVFVSPDGMTHQLVVKGARLSDMGPYSLDTGLYTSSAWLVVETGKDTDLLATSADHQVQVPGAPTSDAEEARSTSSTWGARRQQGSQGGALEGAGLTSGLQLTAGLDRGGLGGRGYSLPGDEGPGAAAWGPGQARRGFLDAEGDLATLPGEGQLHGEWGWDASLPGGPHPQGEGVGSGLGLTEAGSRDSDRDSRGGPAAGWEAGSWQPAVGGLGGRGEGQEPSEDSRSRLGKHSQGWAHLAPGAEERALQGSLSGSVRSEGDVMGESLGKVEGGGGLSRERGSGVAGAAWGSGADWGQSGDSSAVGGPGALASPEGRGWSSGAGRGPETWGPQGQGDDEHGDARGIGGAGQSPGQTPAGKGSQDPSVSGGRGLLPGRGSSQGPGELVDRGPGGPGGWGREGQGTLGAWGEAGDGRGLPLSQGGSADQRGAGGAGRMEAESTGPWGDPGSTLGQGGVRPGPGVLGSGGGTGGVFGTQVPGMMESGRGGDASSHRLTGPPGQGAQGPWGAQGGVGAPGGPGAVGSEPDLWNGMWGSREGAPGAETGREPGSGGPRHGDGDSRGPGPKSGAGYGDGSGAPGERGSAHGAGVPGGAESKDGVGYRDGSRAPGAVWSGSQDGPGPAGRGPGTRAGGPDGGLVDEAGLRPETWDASGGRVDASPGGSRRSHGGLSSAGMVGSGGRGGLGASDTVGALGEGHAGSEPGGSGRMQPRGSAGEAGGFSASGAKGAFGGGGHGDAPGGLGAAGPGSLRAGGKVPGTDATRGPGAGAPDPGAGSGSQRSSGPGSVPGHRDGPGIPGPQPAGSRTAAGGGPMGPGPGGVGPGGEEGFRDGSGGLGGLGSGSQAGHRRDLGAPEGVGSGAQAGPKDGLGGSRGLGSGSEAGYRRDLGAPEGVGSGAQASLKDGLGGSQGLGSGSEAGHRRDLGAPEEVGSGAQASLKDGLGGSRGLGSGSEAGHRRDLGAPEEVGSGAQASLKDGLGGSRGLGSGSEAGYRRDLGAPEEVGSGAQASLKDGLGGSQGLGSGSEAGHRGGPGRPGEMGPEGERGYGDGPGRGGVTGSLAAGEREGASRGPGAEGHGSGYWAAPEGSHGGTSSTGGPKTGKEPGLVNGAGPGAGSGMPGAVGTAGGQGSRTAGASPGDRGASRGEGGSADQAGVGASVCLDGRGAVDRDSGAGTAALGSRPQGGSWEAGPGTAGRGGTAGPGAPGPQGAEDLPLGGRRLADGVGTGSGQVPDRSRMPGQRGEATSESADGPGGSRARAPGSEAQGFERGRAGAGSQPPGSRVEDATFSGTQEGPEGSRRRARATGQAEAGGRRGPGFLESQGSGPGRDRSAGSKDLDGARDGLEGSSGSKESGDRSRDVGGSRSRLSRGGGGERGPLGKQGSLEAETDKPQGPGALEEDNGQGAAESGRSARRPGPLGSGSQAQAGAKAGRLERLALDEARGRRQRPEGRDMGCSGESLYEDGRCEHPCHLGSQRGGTEGKSDVSGRGKDATRSPRSRHTPGTGGFFEEARVPLGHFAQGLADTEVKLGEDAVLSCTLSRDLGPGTWLKDGVELSAQDGLVFQQDGLVHRLLIARVQEAQAGKYSFVVGDQKSEATLTVRDPPVITPETTQSLKEPLVVKAGKPLTVKVAFQSRLPVQATWTKDGADVDAASGRGAQVALGDGVTRLCLPSAGRKDSGQYSLTLRSKGGSVQAEVTVHVIDKSQPPQGPLEVQHCRGTGVCLQWRPPRDSGGRAVERYVVERRQDGRSTWLKVGEPPADSTSFTDAQVEQGKKYSFRVRAVTSEGPGEALESEEVLVAPEALPGPPSAPTILSASSKSVSLSWTAPRGPGSAHILGYLVEKRKKGSSSWTAVTEQPVAERKWTVTDLRPDCQYDFRVTAVAPSGPGQPGPPSEAVFARDPMRPPGPVRDLQVIDTSHTSITVRWAPPDDQEGDAAQAYVVELCVSDSLEWAPCHAGTVPVTTHTAKGLRPQEGYLVRVIAVNNGGCSQPTMLDVVVYAMPPPVSPKFLVDDSCKDSLMVRVGDTIRVPVRFEGSPMPEVIWLKDGLPLSKKSVTFTKDGLTQLLVPVASLSDSGIYSVVLRSPQGKEATYTFVLRVAVKPQAPGPIHLQENVPGTVTAEWEPSPDEAQGVPLHYSVLVRSSGNGPWLEVADRVYTNRFTLLGVHPGHAYHFRVVAKNELGASEPSDSSQPWCIPRRRDKAGRGEAPRCRQPDHSQKPRFLVGLRSHLLPQGCECRMSCAVQGWPRPRVTWFRNGESLEGNPAVHSTDTLGVCSLVIASVSPEDSGLYKAVAENTLGQAVSTATLLVMEPSS